MPWFTKREPPPPDPEPDEGSIYCSCCPERRPRSERRGDVLLCPHCDHPETR